MGGWVICQPPPTLSCGRGYKRVYLTTYMIQYCNYRTIQIRQKHTWPFMEDLCRFGLKSTEHAPTPSPPAGP